jgi:hypothetical protein
MDDAAEPTCGNCRFGRYSHDDSDGGPMYICRRHAPRPVYGNPMNDDEVVWWPNVLDIEWCGEHQPKADGS